MKLFKALDRKQIYEYQQWARANYKHLEPIDGGWHAEVQAECVRMNVEHTGYRRIPEPNEATMDGILNWLGSYQRAEEVLKEMQWSQLNRCWFVTRHNTVVGIEEDGYVHS